MIQNTSTAKCDYYLSNLIDVTARCDVISVAARQSLLLLALGGTVVAGQTMFIVPYICASSEQCKVWYIYTYQSGISVSVVIAGYRKNSSRYVCTSHIEEWYVC